MAKKKRAEGSVSDIEASIIKDFGDIIVSGQYITEQPYKVIPVSPQLDLILGGGIKEGSFCVFTGPPKVGKSVTALTLAAEALSISSSFDSDREMYFFNIEGRLNPRDLLGIHQLIPFLGDKVHIITSQPGNILSGENFLDIGERLINEKPGSIFIFDSFSQLCSASRKEEHIGKRFRDDIPLFLADFCKRICNVVPINKSIVVGITHLIANQGQGMSPWLEASGRKVQYQMDTKLKAPYAKAWEAGDKQVGQDVHWECAASPIGPPGQKGVSKLRYGYGLDNEAELAMICVDIGLIKKGGAWYEMPNNNKVQGLENVCAALSEDKSLYKDLYLKFREMFTLPEVEVK